MNWRNSGFSVHNGVRVVRDDDEGREALSQYIIRNTFSLEKMNYIEETDTVIYHSKMTRGRNKKNFQVYQAEELIAAITQHIPEKSFQTCAELVSVWCATTDGIQINHGGYVRNRASRDQGKHQPMMWR